LMHVRCSINDHDMKALVDTGATHNFIRVETAKRIGLSLSPSDSMMKSVNTVASRSHGVAKKRQISWPSPQMILKSSLGTNS